MACALIPVLYFFWIEAVQTGRDFGFPLDDSWIHLVFARNLVKGQGLSFNPGELVIGSTAPLWTALLSVLFLLPGSVVLWTKLLGVLLHLAVVAASFRLAREMGLARPLAALSGVLVMITDWLLWSALSGMEVPLFTAISLWGIILHLRERRDPERPPLALALFGLSVLARPEGALLAVLAVCDRFLAFQKSTPRPDGAARRELRLATPPWRAIALGVALAALATVPVLLFQKSVGGSFLPSTFGAKTQGGLSWPPQWFDLFRALRIWFEPQPVATLFAAAGFAALVAKLGTRQDRGLLPALWLFGLPLVYSLMRTRSGGFPIGNFGRYFFPLLPVAITLGMLGFRSVGDGLGRVWHVGKVRVPVRALLLAVLLAPTLLAMVEGAKHYAHNVRDVRNSDVEMGRWMKRHLPDDAVVAVSDIGAIAYFGGHKVIDMIGLVTPEILEYLIASASAEDPDGFQGMIQYLEREQPDFIVTFAEGYPQLLHDPRFKTLHHVALSDNITMGGENMVVIMTPWSRYEWRPNTPPQPQPQSQPEAQPRPQDSTP